MTKQTKTIEDYPELEVLKDGLIKAWTLAEFYDSCLAVEQKLLEMQSKIDELTEQNKELQEQKLNQYVSVGYTNFCQLQYMMPNEFSQDAFQNDDDAGLVFQVKCDDDFEVYVSTNTWNRYQDALNKESK